MLITSLHSKSYHLLYRQIPMRVAAGAAPVSDMLRAVKASIDLKQTLCILPENVKTRCTLFLLNY
jgi:hypothetical protein